MTAKARFQRTFSLSEEDNAKLEAVLNSGIKLTDFIREAIENAYRMLKRQDNKSS